MKNSIRFAFVTRHLNRSGYACLKCLIDEGLFPHAIIVSSNKPALVSRFLRPVVLSVYKLKCWYYRCSPLRMLLSEELLAIRHNIKVISLDSLKTHASYNKILKLDLDLLVVAGGWHEKIPLNVLQAPSQGSINVHPSLLPEFRGTSITRWQVLHGVTTSGVTIHEMDAEFDSGANIDQAVINLPDNTNPQTLFQILAEQSGPLLIKVIRAIANDRLIPCDFRRPNKVYHQYFNKWAWNAAFLTADPAENLLSIGRRILAATQESFEYPGIALRLNGQKFFIREVEIAPRKYHDSEFRDRCDMISIEKDILFWERAGETKSLIIKRIQPCRLYFLRRSDVPGRWINCNSRIVISSASN